MRPGVAYELHEWPKCWNGMDVMKAEPPLRKPLRPESITKSHKMDAPRGHSPNLSVRIAAFFDVRAKILTM